MLCLGEAMPPLREAMLRVRIAMLRLRAAMFHDARSNAALSLGHAAPPLGNASPQRNNATPCAQERYELGTPLPRMLLGSVTHGCLPALLHDIASHPEPLPSIEMAMTVFLK